MDPTSNKLKDKKKKLRSTVSESSLLLNGPWLWCKGFLWGQINYKGCESIFEFGKFTFFAQYEWSPSDVAVERPCVVYSDTRQILWVKEISFWITGSDRSSISLRIGCNRFSRGHGYLWFGLDFNRCLPSTSSARASNRLLWANFVALSILGILLMITNAYFMGFQWSFLSHNYTTRKLIHPSTLGSLMGGSVMHKIDFKSYLYLHYLRGCSSFNNLNCIQMY